MPNRREVIAGARFVGRRTLSAAAVTVTAFGLFWPASLATSTFVEAKTPGKTYCFLGKCHRVRTLAETQRLVGVKQIVRASHYDDPRRDRFNPSNLTSSGEWFRAGAADNAASPILPNGTIILAYNPTTRKAAVLRINNAGPYWGDRTLDVSRGAAHKLGFAGHGVATLITKVIHAPSLGEATYSRGRRYAAVPGFIGTYASADAALIDAHHRMGSTAPGTLVPNPGSPAPDSPVPASTAVVAAAQLPADLPVTVATAESPPESLPTTASPSSAAAASAPSSAIVAMAPRTSAFQANLQPASSLTIGGGGGIGFGSTTVDAVAADRPSRRKATSSRTRSAAARMASRNVEIDWASPRRSRSTRTSKRTITVVGVRPAWRIAKSSTENSTRNSSANSSNSGRRHSDQNGYFSVDCRSDLCAASGRSASGKRWRTALRTSAVSSSNRP